MPNAPPKGFALHLVAGRHIDSLSYRYEDPAWKTFLETSPLGETWLTDDDIARYDWETQELVLTKPASERVRAALSKGAFELAERSFIATLDDRRLYAGTVLFVGSARAIDYPVIYVDESRPEGVVLQLRPTHSVTLTYERLPPESKKRIALPEVKEHFAKRGKAAPQRAP